MPRDTGGNYSLPSGYLAVSGQTILPSQHNPPLEDIASALTASLPRDGSAGMAAPLKVADGSAASPAVAFASESGTGFYKISTGKWGLSIQGTLAASFDSTGLTGTGFVTYPKIQNVSSGALLGNFSGVSAIPAEITLGTGLKSVPKSSSVTITIASPGVVTWASHGLAASAPVVLSTTGILPTGLSAGTVYYVVNPATNTFQLAATPGGGTINTTGVQSGTHTATSTTVISAPAFAPPAAFKNLSIKVTGNTGVTLAADYITVTSGAAFQTLTFNATINFATNGAAGLDTGTIAAGTWYAIWAIAKEDGATSAIASASGSSPTMPAGYTYKARVGWVRTASGSAQLMGTWQLGRRARYILSLAQTGALPLMDSGAVGAAITPTWVDISVGNFVPTTASAINVTISGPDNIIIAAPNNHYSGTGSVQNPPPLQANGSGSVGSGVRNGDLLLEGSTIYWASNASSGRIICGGWEDNI